MRVSFPLSPETSLELENGIAGSRILLLRHEFTVDAGRQRIVSKMRFRGFILGCLIWITRSVSYAGNHSFFEHPACDVKTLSAYAQMVLKQVKPGKKRSWVQKFFHMDGGGQTETYTRYCFSFDEVAADNKVVKIDIIFLPAGMDDATFQNADRCRAWLDAHPREGLEKPDDTVTAVGNPYRERPETD